MGEILLTEFKNIIDKNDRSLLSIKNLVVEYRVDGVVHAVNGLNLDI